MQKHAEATRGEQGGEVAHPGSGVAGLLEAGAADEAPGPPAHAHRPQQQEQEQSGGSSCRPAAEAEADISVATTLIMGQVADGSWGAATLGMACSTTEVLVRAS